MTGPQRWPLHLDRALTSDPCPTCLGTGVKQWEALTAEERDRWNDEHNLIPCDCTPDPQEPT